MHLLSVEIDDRSRRILVRVEFDKREATISLHANLDNVAEALKERYQVGLSRKGNEVADVDGRVEGWRCSRDGAVLRADRKKKDASEKSAFSAPQVATRSGAHRRCRVAHSSLRHRTRRAGTIWPARHALCCNRAS